MIKVPPPTQASKHPEILIADGISVNLTLLFSRAQTLKAYAAYARGIAKRLAAGQSVAHIRRCQLLHLPRGRRAGRHAARPPQRQNRHRPCQSRLLRLGAILRQP